MRDIQAHLNQLYGVDVLPTLISNVTNRIMPLIKEWQSRPLQKTYAVVFLDAIHYKVKQEGHIVNKAVYCYSLFSTELYNTYTHKTIKKIYANGPELTGTVVIGMDIKIYTMYLV